MGLRFVPSAILLSVVVGLTIGFLIGRELYNKLPNATALEETSLQGVGETAPDPWTQRLLQQQSQYSLPSHPFPESIFDYSQYQNGSK